MENNDDLSVLETLAQYSTCQALKDYAPIPSEMARNLTLGTRFEDKFRVFELYSINPQTQRPVTIALARIHKQTKLVEVTIPNLTKLNIYERACASPGQEA